ELYMDTGARGRNLGWNAAIVWSSHPWSKRDFARASRAWSVRCHGMSAACRHILRKHVGQTDDQLLERLRREPRITGASTYTDRSAAEHAVGAAIGES